MLAVLNVGLRCGEPPWETGLGWARTLLLQVLDAGGAGCEKKAVQGVVMLFVEPVIAACRCVVVFSLYVCAFFSRVDN